MEICVTYSAPIYRSHLRENINGTTIRKEIAIVKAAPKCVFERDVFMVTRGSKRNYMRCPFLGRAKRCSSLLSREKNAGRDVKGTRNNHSQVPWDEFYIERRTYQACRRIERSQDRPSRNRRSDTDATRTRSHSSRIADPWILACNCTRRIRACSRKYHRARKESLQQITRERCRQLKTVKIHKEGENTQIDIV